MVYAYETEEKKNDNARIRNAHRVHSANESNYKLFILGEYLHKIWISFEFVAK